MEREMNAREKAVKKFYWRLHHWVGLYTGILIGMLSLTGALAVFIPEIDSLVKRHYYQAFASPLSGQYPMVGSSISALIEEFPEYKSLSVHLPRTQKDVAVIELTYPENGKTARYEFFVDSGRDKIVGKRLWQNTFANYLRQIHVRLYEGKWGRQLVGIAGVGLVLVSVTGLLIYGNFMKRQKWPQIRKKMNLRIQMADWHKVIGISALAFNLVIGLTGAWLGLQPWLMKLFSISTPGQSRLERMVEPEVDRGMKIDWNMIIPSVNKNFPELEPSQINISTNGMAAITVRGSVKGQIFERNTNTIVLSKNDYRPLFKYDLKERPLSEKFYYIQEALHFGDFGGMGLKILYAFLGLTSGFLSISGFVIFLYRKNKKSEHNRSSTFRMVFLVSLMCILFMSVIAFISMNLGYSRASSIAGILINGTICIWLVFEIIIYLRQKMLLGGSGKRRSGD